jgi:hypothetical protein
MQKKHRAETFQKEGKVGRLKRREEASTARAPQPEVGRRVNACRGGAAAVAAFKGRALLPG